MLISWVLSEIEIISERDRVKFQFFKKLFLSSSLQGKLRQEVPQAGHLVPSLPIFVFFILHCPSFNARLGKKLFNFKFHLNLNTSKESFFYKAINMKIMRRRWEYSKWKGDGRWGQFWYRAINRNWLEAAVRFGTQRGGGGGGGRRRAREFCLSSSSSQAPHNGTEYLRRAGGSRLHSL